MNKYTTYEVILAAVLTNLRKEAGSTQLDFSNKCGLPQSTIARIEVGRASTLNNLLCFAEGLNMPLGEIITKADRICVGMRKLGVEVAKESKEYVDRDPSKNLFINRKLIEGFLLKALSEA